MGNKREENKMSMQQSGINVKFVDVYGNLIIRISLQRDLQGDYKNGIYYSCDKSNC